VKLGARKIKVLEAIVNSYIITGEPVSSKSLCDDLRVSSSTVRSDMAELTHLGLLEQPHASSGRVPSHSGYRFYINQLMSQGTYGLSLKNKEELARPIFSCKVNDPENFLKDVIDIIAEITKCVAVSAIPTKNSSVIQAIKLVFVEDRVIMVILVTSLGIVKNKLILCERCLDQETLAIIQRILQDKLKGLEISKVNIILSEILNEDFTEISPVFSKFLEVIIDLTDEVVDAGINLTGESNLFFYPDFNLDSISGLINFFNSPNEALSFLERNQDDDINVLVGEENELCEFDRFSVIISKYNFLKQNDGIIAIVGPTRMDYAKIIPTIRYLSSLTSKFLDENFGF
jgi:heat-inducible transcriptional repressor